MGHSVSKLFNCITIVLCCVSHHHGEDGEELLLRDAVVAVEVVHAEGDCKRVKQMLKSHSKI